MLGRYEANATIAVRDLDRAAAFYEGVLGLARADVQQPGALRYRSGGSTLFVYVSRYAGTNRATAVTWNVDDVDALVRDLAAKGARFEHYDDLPETHREGDVHVAGDLRLAWLTDPDGNVLALAGRG
jgi:catechol 2,3-dioxygenase-like lactoylglutathione lyase family enzyme